MPVAHADSAHEPLDLAVVEQHAIADPDHLERFRQRASDAVPALVGEPRFRIGAKFDDLAPMDPQRLVHGWQRGHSNLAAIDIQQRARPDVRRAVAVDPRPAVPQRNNGHVPRTTPGIGELDGVIDPQVSDPRGIRHGDLARGRRGAVGAGRDKPHGCRLDHPSERIARGRHFHHPRSRRERAGAQLGSREVGRDTDVGAGVPNVPGHPRPRAGIVVRTVDPGDIHSRRHEPRHERRIIGGRARQRHHDPCLAVFGGATQQRRGVHTQGSGDRGPPIRSGFLPVCQRALPQGGVDRAQDGIEVVQHIGFHAPERGEPLGGQTILEVAQIPRPQGDIADEVGGAGAWIGCTRARGADAARSASSAADLSATSSARRETSRCERSLSSILRPPSSTLALSVTARQGARREYARRPRLRRVRRRRR
nr:hypothetical protein [Microbacterium schleiferi]